MHTAAQKAKARARQRTKFAPAANDNVIRFAPPLELTAGDVVHEPAEEAPFAPPPVDDIFGLDECEEDETIFVSELPPVELEPIAEEPAEAEAAAQGAIDRAEVGPGPLSRAAVAESLSRLNDRIGDVRQQLPGEESLIDPAMTHAPEEPRSAVIATRGSSISATDQNNGQHDDTSSVSTDDDARQRLAKLLRAQLSRRNTT